MSVSLLSATGAKFIVNVKVTIQAVIGFHWKSFKIWANLVKPSDNINVLRNLLLLNFYLRKFVEVVSKNKTNKIPKV